MAQLNGHYPVTTNGNSPKVIPRKKPSTISDEELAVAIGSTKSLPPSPVTPLANEHTDLPSSTAIFTPLQSHYLLKALVSFEMQKEWSALGSLGALTKFSPPFASDSNATISHNTKGGAPPIFKPDLIHEPTILRHLFRTHILSFPGLDTAPKKYWQRRIQPWFDGVASHGLSTSAERREPTKRLQLSLLFTRLIGTYFSRGITVDLDDKTQTISSEFVVRPGAREIRAVDNVFPGAHDSVNPEGWYVGVVDAPHAHETFVVGSQKKGEAVFFAQHTQSAFEWLDIELHALAGAAGASLPIYSPIAYSSTSMSVHLQTYLRSVLAVTKQLPATAVAMLEHFLTVGDEDVPVDLKSNLHRALKDQDSKLVPVHRAWTKAGQMVDEIQNAWRSWIGFLIEDPRGVDKTWRLLETEKYTDLPERERLCVEKAGIWVAYFLHGLFVSGPNAKEFVSWVRWALSLIPWWAVRQTLRIADPSKMVGALLAVILARPLGFPSLVQRLMSAMLGSQASRFREEAKAVEHTISEHEGREQGEKFFAAIHHYVFKTSVDGREEIRNEATKNGHLLVEVVVRSPVDSNTLPHLQKLLSLLTLARDYDSLIEFSSSAAFVKVIKDSVNVVLYGPLTKWSKHCHLNDRVYDFQVFLDDLVQTARSKDNSLAAFLALAQRHQQKLYYLFHEAHVRGGDLMDPVRDWCTMGMDYIRTSSLDPHGKDETAPRIHVDIEAIASDPSVSKDDIVRETDQLINWTKWTKLRWHIEMRRNVLLQQGGRGLAEKVDVDEIVHHVARQLGEEKVDHVANGSNQSTVSSSDIALRDQYAWAWFAEAGVHKILDELPSLGIAPRAGPLPLRFTEIRKLVGPFLRSIAPDLRKVDEIEATRLNH